jgi:hypothetical protein
LFILAADSAVFLASQGIAHGFLAAFHAKGLYEGAANTANNPALFYLIANALLKCWITCAYMSQSFYGISHGVTGSPDTQQFVFVMVS